MTPLWADESLRMAVQAGITVFSGLAAWLTNDRRQVVRKWAPVFGLVSQPFWIASSLQSGAWGVLLISGWYTLCWARGIRNSWFSNGGQS